jgi:hypothetical protein
MRAWVTALLLAGLVAANTLWAGPVAPELIPFDSDFAAFGPMRPYHVALRDALLGARRGHRCDVLVVPSFEREWAAYVRRGDGDAAVAAYAVMQSSLWGEMNLAAEAAGGPHDQEALDAALARVPKRAHVMSSPIRSYTATLMERAWQEMFARARERPPNARRTIDGTGYYFLQRSSAGGWRAGGAWSPQAGTNTAALTDVVHALREHATASEDRRAASEAHLVSQALTLLRKLSDGSL